MIRLKPLSPATLLHITSAFHALLLHSCRIDSKLSSALRLSSVPASIQIRVCPALLVDAAQVLADSWLYSTFFYAGAWMPAAARALVVHALAFMVQVR